MTTEAQRLADLLIAWSHDYASNKDEDDMAVLAAAHLRRLDGALRVAVENIEICNELYRAISTELRNEQARFHDLLALYSQMKKEHAECEQLRADAERYRWLVARSLNGDDEFYISAQDSAQANADGWWALGGDMSKSEADAYIDAAIAKETK